MKFSHGMELTRGSRPPRPHPSEGVVIKEVRDLQGSTLVQVIHFTDRVETRVWKKRGDTFFLKSTTQSQEA